MPRTRYHARIMDAQSVDETKSTVLGPAICGQVREGALYVVFSPGVTAGVVEIEDAHVGTFSGTWSNMATVNWVAPDRVHRVNYTGVHMYVRARISTAIADGTVSVEFIGN